MTIDEMYLEIEQTSKYGTPLLTTDAVKILARIRSMDAKIKLADELVDYILNETYFLEVARHKAKAYREAGEAIE